LRITGLSKLSTSQHCFKKSKKIFKNHEKNLFFKQYLVWKYSELEP
jgi:hypothetical protein